MPEWTAEQARAIKSRGSNLLLAAAAGSGKTAVLVERILDIIVQDQIDIDRLLIVTFTQAAAAEMRERINTAIFRQLQAGIPEQQAHLRKQLNLLNRASISTIHSFCREVVKKYFYLLDIDPNFRVADAAETLLMKIEVLDEYIESEYGKGDEDFLNLVEMFAGGKTDQPLIDLILKVYEFVQNQPDPAGWMKNSTACLLLDDDQLAHSEWMREIARQAAQELDTARLLLNKALQISEKPGGPAGYLKTLQQDIDQVEGLIRASSQGLGRLYEQLEVLAFARLKPAGKEADASVSKRAKELRDRAKKVVNSLSSGLLGKKVEEYNQELHYMAPAMLCLCRLVTGFTELYGQKKADKNILDFNDLEHDALTIFKNADAVQDYRNKYEYIFIDEYQDSNMLQETLLSSICRSHNLFMVGDIKQSIYRFRRAEPTLFLHKYETFQTEDSADNLRIDLSRNFRSRRGILEGINYIFRIIMSRDLGEIDYDDSACLYPGLPEDEDQGAGIEICLLEKNGEDANIDDEIAAEIEELSDVAVEAKVVAGQIKELVGSEIYDARNRCFRRVDFRDIVILMRATRGWAGEFLEVFSEEGIPVYSDAGGGYFEAVEVEVMLNLLKVIDNRRQDIPLLCVMRSPIAHFNADELTDIRLSSSGRSYYEAMEYYLETHEDDLSRKLRYFLARIDKWHKEAAVMPVDEFIYHLLMDTGYHYYAGSMPGGKQRQANLEVLVERARQFQASSIKGLFNFSRFMENIKSSSGDMEPASILGENDNVVRLMSIHKSKGLEFPVVIVAGLGKQFNKSDTRAPVLLHSRLGMGPRYIHPELRIKSKTAAGMAMQNRIEIENLSEEMRVLYVAMSRAESKLILVGSLKNLEKKVSKWCSMDSSLELSKAQSAMDWIGAALVRHSGVKELQSLAGEAMEDMDRKEDTSRWKITLYNRRALQQETQEKREMKELFAVWMREYRSDSGNEEKKKLLSRLDWEYPYQQAVDIPSKLSVSQLKKMGPVSTVNSADTGDTFLEDRSLFAKGLEEDSGFTAQEKGSLLHLFLQHIDFQEADSREAIENQLQNLVRQEVLSPAEAPAIPVEAVLRFTTSTLGKRVAAAREVHRERPFNRVCNTEEVLSRTGNMPEKLLIQGVIDLYFMEGGQAILVDYKTDHITPANRRERIDLYALQLQQYRLAIEEIEGIAVKESYIYFFAAGEAVRIQSKTGAPVGQEVY